MRRGLTLGEVVIALGLLTVAALALMSVFGGGLRLSGQVKHSLTATQLAKSELESLQSGRVRIPAPAHFAGEAPVDEFPPAPYPVTTVNDVEYRTTVTTEPVPDAPGVINVIVKVQWNEDPGVVLQSYFHPI